VRRKNDLGQDPVGALILRLALPTMLAQFINVLYSIVDRMFIGHIPLVGDLALAGVGVCGPIVTLLSSFSYLACLGGGPLFSMKMGAGDRNGASSILSNCLRMLLALAAGLSLLFFLLWKNLLWWFGASPDTFPYALTYMTIYILGTAFALMAAGLNNFLICQGRSGLGMATVVLGAGLNICLDPLFIFALDMGVAGAAWATLLSQAASCAFALAALTRPSMPVPLRWGQLDLAVCKKILTFGMAPFLTYALDSVILIILNTVLQRQGGPGEGDALLTCCSIVQSYMLLIAMPMSGITLGCQGVISFNLGAGSAQRVKKALKGVFALCFSFAGIMLAVTHLACPLFVRLFTQNEYLMGRSVTLIKVYTAGVLFLPVQWTAVDGSTALGQTRLALFCSLLRKTIFVSAVVGLPCFLPAASAFCAEPLCDVTAACVSAALFFRFTPRTLAAHCVPVDRDAAAAI
jgi:putative MATE family efflux protein